MTNTPYIAFALVELLFSLTNNRNVDIAYGRCINYLKLSFKRQNTFKNNTFKRQNTFKNRLINHHKYTLSVLKSKNKTRIG